MSICLIVYLSICLGQTFLLQRKKLEKSLAVPYFLRTFAPAFGVIAGRKTRVACYVAHETIQQTNKKH